MANAADTCSPDDAADCKQVAVDENIKWTYMTTYTRQCQAYDMT